MFSKLYSRIEIAGTLKADTALYIGAGQENFDPLAVQGSLLKDSFGKPYIPGSSLKGVLRSFLESVQEFEWACERGEGCPKKLELTNKAGRTRLMKVLDGDSEGFAETIEARSCMACRLFGSGILAGKVKLRDAYLAKPDAWNGTGLRTGNAIERDTHTTVGGALFDTEFIPPGTEFSFKMIAENLTYKEAEMLGAILEIFAHGGISVGGRSRAGLGEIVVTGLTAKLMFINKESGSFAGLATEEEAIQSAVAIADLLSRKNASAPEPSDLTKHSDPKEA